MNVFVTVGTTKFDELVDVFCDQEFIKQLKNIKKLTIQYGKSQMPVLQSPHIVFDYTDKFVEIIYQNDIIISHAAAGTRLDVISAEKPHIMIANRNLHGDHQAEMVQAVNETLNSSVKGFLDIKEFKEFLIQLDQKQLQKMTKQIEYPDSQYIIDMVSQTVKQKDNGTYLLLSFLAIVLYINIWILQKLIA